MSVTWITETYDNVTSTQDIIKGMAEIGHPEGMVVRADEQSAGMGRHGRKWVSDKGNLFMSVLLRPSCHASQIGLLSLAAGVATAKAIRTCLDKPGNMVLKWPNDVLLGEDKCAGILMETDLTQNQSVKYMALGIGVNIEAAPKREGTSLKAHSKKPPKPAALCKAILKELDYYYGLWSRDGGGDIRAEWLALGPKKGSKVRVRIGIQVEQGHFHGLDEDGALLLQDSELRIRKVTAGDVYL